MAFTRGRFGIEYNQARRRDDDSPRLLPWVLALVGLAALVSLALTIAGRARTRAAERAAVPAAPTRPPPPPAEIQSTPPPPPLKAVEAARRPTRVRNLLMRLEAAEKARDIDMAASTIEQIRALPGNPAADLDDPLARRLGTLNIRRLFLAPTSPWTTAVTVKRGDSASRIAREHGSTLASLVKLNGGGIDRLNIGATLKVLNHPRFSLAVRRAPRTADLSLNGKFFKRYYLTAPVSGRVGVYETPDVLRRFFSEQGISLKTADRAELETLLPKGTPVQVAEF